MNIFQKIFGKKKKEQPPVKPPYYRPYSTLRGGNNYQRDNYDSMTDVSSPLNPLSPFYIGNSQNDELIRHNDINFDGGSFGGGGASGSWDSPHESSHHSSDSGSSYDSGSSSNYDSGSSSSDSSSCDSGSSSSSD